MNYLALLVVVLVPCALAEPVLSFPDIEVMSEWETFKQTYKRYYGSEEEHNVRQEIFLNNLKHIASHNELYRMGEKSYYLGVNQFTDMSHAEFLQYYTDSLLPNTQHDANVSVEHSLFFVKVPSTIDWRQQGYVTKVKNQGRCGSCWSFSATGAIEGQHYRKTRRLVSLSEQQLVDCSGSYGNKGCKGGFMDEAFNYVRDVGGVEGEADYAYTAMDGTCKFDKSKVKATVTGHVDVPAGSETRLQEAVGNLGPVSVAIDASQPSFQSYAGGVYNEPLCSSTRLNHGVLVVGYGTAPSAYWLVKNSWGATWGDSGYIKMSRNQYNQCGIASSASYPTV